MDNVGSAISIPHRIPYPSITDRLIVVHSEVLIDGILVSEIVPITSAPSVIGSSAACTDIALNNIQQTSK